MQIRPSMPSPLLILFWVRTVERPEASIVVNTNLIFSIRNPSKPSLPLLHYYHIFSRPRTDLDSSLVHTRSLWIRYPVVLLGESYAGIRTLADFSTIVIYTN
jgi:hypothetical protein